MSLALAVDPVAGWIFMSGGGWVQRARLDASEPALLYNGTALAGIALDTQVFLFIYILIYIRHIFLSLYLWM